MTFVRIMMVALLVACGFARAAPPQQQAEREIEALIAGLGSSGCEFERNGSWYDAAQAEEHLRTKYEWLRKRGMADSAEKFIERGASQSSVSGKNYQVRCPGKPVTESGIWFRALLTRQRAGSEPR